MMITRKHWCVFSSAANKRSNRIFTVLFFLFIGAAHAQDALPLLATDFSQKNPASQYQIGDRIQLDVRIPLSLFQDLQAIRLQNADEKNPLDQQGWYLDPSPQVINGNLRFQVSPLKSGKLTLPELTLSKEGNQAIAKTSSVTVDVAELSANPAEPPKPLDTIEIPLPKRFIAWGLAILVTLSFLGYFLYRKYRNRVLPVKKTEPIHVPPTPDHVIALRDLQFLYEQHSFSKENLKPIAFGVSQILKNFFSARFKVDARESTTEEMLELLKKESLPPEEVRRITALFKDLDLIKFTELQHHQHFQKGDYLEFKDHARSLIENWTIKGGPS